ncbi:MAG: ATP-binding protein [Anaerolineae bacterium]
MIELISILRNSALLLSLTLIYSLFIPTLQRLPEYVRQLITGTLFGLFAIFAMSDPIIMFGGALMDSRHVIVMVAAILSGWRGGLISAVITSGFRVYLGGIGVTPGVLSIITAYMLGALHYRITRGSIRFDRDMLITALILPIMTLMWVLTLPDGLGWRNLLQFAPALLIVYPLATYLVLQLLNVMYDRFYLSNMLWQYKQRQTAMFQRTPNLLLMLDIDGTVLEINPAAATFLGRDASELLGRPSNEISRSPQSPPMEQFQAGFFKAAQGVTHQETLAFNRDGEKVILNIFFIPIRDQQEQISMIFINATDITDELRLQEQALDLKFQRDRNDILQQLIADASHHLRTPLSIIGSSLYLLRKHMEPALVNNSKQQVFQQHISKLETAQYDLNKIVDDLLNMMRLDNREQYLFAKHDLISFTAEIIEGYRIVAHERQITLTAKLPDERLTITMAVDALRYMLENLISNALRYSSAGGTVIVCIEQDMTYAIISVSDEGVGIPAEDLPFIFDRFYRASNALEHTRKGTGLGLAIVRKTVDMHGGEISISSTIGEGTTFTVRLPLEQSAREQ